MYNIPVTMAIFWKERTPVCALVTVIHEAAIGFRRHPAVFSWVSLYDASQRVHNLESFISVFSISFTACKAPKLDHGRVIGTSRETYASRQETSFSCDPGYSLSDSYPRMCRCTRGTCDWFPSLPKCVRGMRSHYE